ncbi:MAG: hypothetical protein ACI976_001814 [Aureispira sp.]|jgi:hypothetical protein
MGTPNKWFYCSKTTREHPLSKKYKDCLDLLDDITKNESDKKIKTPFLNEVTLNLDAVEKATTRVKNQATMDVAFGISKNEGKSGQIILCEYRLNYKSVNKISKSGLEAKIKGSSGLLGGEVPIYKPYLFVFNSSIKASAVSKLRRFSSNKVLYRALDIQDLYDDFFKIDGATTFGKTHK